MILVLLLVMLVSWVLMRCLFGKIVIEIEWEAINKPLSTVQITVPDLRPFGPRTLLAQFICHRLAVPLILEVFKHLDPKQIEDVDQVVVAARQQGSMICLRRCEAKPEHVLAYQRGEMTAKQFVEGWL